MVYPELKRSQESQARQLEMSQWTKCSGENTRSQDKESDDTGGPEF